MTGELSLPIWIVGLALVVIVGLIAVLWSLHRRASPRFAYAGRESFTALGASLSGVTNSPTIDGNEVAIIENGKLFDRWIEDISNAQHSVHLETFLWKSGKLGSRIADALSERGKAGLAVRVLVDAQGSKDIGDDVVERMRQSGCHFSWSNAYRIRRLGRFNRRDHRKLLIVDGQTAYVGGHCIVDTWLGDAEDKKHFRDVTARVTGPAVHAIQSVFEENWVAATGELLLGKGAFPDLAETGATPLHVVRSQIGEKASNIKVLHHVAIATASKRILIQNPYFLPDPEAIDLLEAAVARGVEVKVMTPSAEASDMPIVQRAAQNKYGRMLDAGVRIFEYQKTLLHQKLLTIDGCWAAIGSSNFDDRSFEINDEITMGIFDEALAAQFEAIFDRDVRDCVELDAGTWKRRSLVKRTIDAFLYAFNEQL